jgi:hypothetical protein
MSVHRRSPAPSQLATFAWLLALAPVGMAQQETTGSTPVEPALPVSEIATFAPFCPGPAVLVTRTGEELTTTRGFEVDGSRVRYHGANGTLVAVRLSEIDISATETAERRRCPAQTDPEAAAAERAAQSRQDDPVGQVIDALVELGVARTRLESLARDRAAFRAAVDAVVSVATELERRTREIEHAYRLDTVGGMLAAAPAYRELASFARAAAARESDPRIGAVIGDLATAFDEVARLAAEEPERAIEEFERQRPPR